jgi:hypothetical protein
MNSASFFRRAIAKRLAQKAACTEAHALKLLGMPKVGRHGQFTIPLSKLLTSFQDEAQDIANKVRKRKKSTIYGLMAASISFLT